MSSERRAAYEQFVKPTLMQRLRALALDFEYERGEGDTLYFRQADGSEVAVLDLVGGFGATLLGHNHPTLVAAARRVLDEQRPFLAQGSARGEAGVLAERLAARLGSVTNREYVATFTNSGAEAIEAAIKHAELERRLRWQAVQDELERRHHELRLRLREQTAVLPEDLFRDAARRFGVEAIHTLDELMLRLSRAILDALEQRPLLLALEGAFHGKTLGALQLTHNPQMRTAWQHLGPRVLFLPVGDESTLAQVVATETLAYPMLELDDHGVARLTTGHVVNIAACFVEPIQGEGGVREVPAAYLRALRAAADAAEFPLIIDEIQSGMGRTGTFLASEAAGVRGDYYTLAKTLSGGLAKIAVLLVDRERYQPHFGYVHTSTYAEDHFSAAVANATLDVLEGDEVLLKCRVKGEYLRRRLEELQRRYPDQIVEVRGRGLMLGIELGAQQDSRSPLLRVLGEQDRLGQFLAGYFLHEERIRVLPTLSAGATLRLQPSAFIEEAALDRFCAALERACEALRCSDASLLSRYLVGNARSTRSKPAPSAPPKRAARPSRPGQAHVGFLAHFLEPGTLRSWDPTLGDFSDNECAQFLGRTTGAIEPFVVGQSEIESALGNRVTVTVLGLAFTPEQALLGLRQGNGDVILDLIHRGVAYARRLGCSAVGFGGYTSILTNNCRAVVASDIGITSGNSLTAASALEAALLAAKRRDLRQLRLGVVGAAGNIGAVLAEVAAEAVDELVLVGQPRAQRRLERTRDAIARDAGRPKIEIATDMGALRDCNIIVSATNAAEPVVLPEHVGTGTVIISDVAVPRDVAPQVSHERPNAVVLKGGMVRAPLGQTVDLEELSLRPGELYGCLAETVLLGLAGLRENFSYGPLRALQVRRARDLARMHGFIIEENRA